MPDTNVFWCFFFPLYLLIYSQHRGLWNQWRLWYVCYVIYLHSLCLYTCLLFYLLLYVFLSLCYGRYRRKQNALNYKFLFPFFFQINILNWAEKESRKYIFGNDYFYFRQHSRQSFWKQDQWLWTREHRS